MLLDIKERIRSDLWQYGTGFMLLQNGYNESIYLKHS